MAIEENLIFFFFLPSASLTLPLSPPTQVPEKHADEEEADHRCEWLGVQVIVLTGFCARFNGGVGLAVLPEGWCPSI